MPKNPPKLITAYATWPERLLTMKLYTVPSRSPWRLYTAVPSTLLDAIRSRVSSVSTEPDVVALVPAPMPDVVVPLMPEPVLDVFAIVASSAPQDRGSRTAAFAILRGLGLLEPPSPDVPTVWAAICLRVHPSW